MIGTGIGALAGGIPTFGTAVVQGFGARGQRKHDTELAKATRAAEADEARAKREHEDATRRRQLGAEMLADRRAKIANWREQLRYARNVHGEWNPGGRYEPPNVVGDEWFEELRPHLPSQSPYKRATEVVCDIETVAALSMHIGDVEAKWEAEARD